MCSPENQNACENPFQIVNAHTEIVNGGFHDDTAYVDINYDSDPGAEIRLIIRPDNNIGDDYNFIASVSIIDPDLAINLYGDQDPEIHGTLSSFKDDSGNDSLIIDNFTANLDIDNINELEIIRYIKHFSLGGEVAFGMSVDLNNDEIRIQPDGFQAGVMYMEPGIGLTQMFSEQFDLYYNYLSDKESGLDPDLPEGIIS